MLVSNTKRNHEEVGRTVPRLWSTMVSTFLLLLDEERPVTSNRPGPDRHKNTGRLSGALLIGVPRIDDKQNKHNKLRRTVGRNKQNERKL